MYDEDYCNYKHYQKIFWGDIRTWDFEELSLVTKERITEYFASGRFFNGLEFMENAKEILSNSDLLKSYEITIVSMGDYPNLKGKSKWISENLPWCKKEFICTKYFKDKSCIDMTDGIMIDDHAGYLESCNADMKILYGEKMDYNKDWQGIRCTNWTEVLNLLVRRKG